jgi:demethylmenaquinone methyltransferase/2-methoxy-6-polyprenyl-1,4-benzoquinol methylase
MRHVSERTRHASRMFGGIAPQYERMGRVLSLGQEARVRRFMVDRIGAPPGSLALDVACGTGLVSRELAARKLMNVVSLDPSGEMLECGGAVNRSAALEDRIHLVRGRAERLPFPDGTFDALTFTYLLRYVDDPPAAVSELARSLRPGGSLACLEFWVPEAPAPRWGWWLYTRLVLPTIGAAVSPAWARTGAFLGPSISSFVEENPLPTIVRWFQDAGIRHVRTRTFLLGTWIVLWGVKEK